MSVDDILEDLQNSPEVAKLAPILLGWAAEEDQPTEYLQNSLDRVRKEIGGDSLVLVCPDRGLWKEIAQVGTEQPLPESLLSNVLDSGQTQSAGQWIASPLYQHSEKGELLVLRGPRVSGQEKTFQHFARLVGLALASVRRQQHRSRRIRRLEAILEIAGQWNQTNEMEPLLVQMAETSTRLLGAQRASIFLWDQPNKTLVGRPALGVEGGELRIPDDRGLVGQVVQSGQPGRVDLEIDQEKINRQVDNQLGFQTHTLLCVPLRGKSGKLFGAFEMINKLSGNFTQEDEDALVELAAHAGIALENTQEYQQLLSSRKQMAEEAAQQVQLIGQSPSIDALRSTISRVAATELAVLILGENGTGKEVVAQLLHYLSCRRNEPIIAVNCAAITETLLESELFGHEKGAFTDAHQAREGKFELASGGTIFLDEIGDLSLGGQSKLLRVLEEKVVVRVGGSTPIHTDSRVIAATNQDLSQMVRDKKFREDLYFRLNVVTLELPPLRDRDEDVLLLIEYFLKDFCAKARRKLPSFTSSARQRLLSHRWPGNVRELRNLSERLAYLTQGDIIDLSDLGFVESPNERSSDVGSLEQSLAEATGNFQRQYIEQRIQVAGGNMSDAARKLGLHRSNLYRKMKQLEMPTEEES